MPLLDDSLIPLNIYEKIFKEGYRGTFLGGCEVAQAKGLRGIMAKIYVAYMMARWADEQTIQCQTGYASEWADRFLSGCEFEASDMIGQEVLKDLCSLYRKKEAL